MALFGTQWEDTFGRVIDKTDIAKGKVEDFKGATEGLSTGTITETEKMSRAWDQFTTDFGEAMATQINHRDQFAEAENDALMSTLGFSDQVALATDSVFYYGVSLDGTSRKFQELADSVGGYASPAFVDLVKKMSDSQLAALGVTRTMDGLGRTVLTLPGGKQIVIDTNSGRVISDLAGVRNSVNSLPTQKFFTYFMDTVVRGPGPGTANLPMPFRASGGAAVGHAAEGGPRSGLTHVNEQGPELLRTQRGDLRSLQSGQTVVPAGQSAMIAAAAAGGGGIGGGGPIVINLILDRRTLGTATVDVLREKARTQAGGDITRLLRGTA